MKSDFVEKDVVGHVLFALTTPNRLACKVALETGLRIDDVLNIPSHKISLNSFTITEQKTGKKRKVRLSAALRRELLSFRTDSYFLFPHRFDENKHRTRQAVYTDLKRACKAFRIKENFTCHSLRKVFAVDMMKSCGSIKKVSAALNHDDIVTTMIYAMADVLTERINEK